METLNAILLGIIQGLTEFLPVSSSAHLIIFSNLLSGKTIPLTFNVAMHIGTLLAVFAYFRRDWQQMILAITKKIAPIKPSILTPTVENEIYYQKLFIYLIIGSIPAGIVGLSWEDEIEKTFHNPIFVTIPLALFGFLIWLGDKHSKQNLGLTQMTWFHSTIIGAAQALALIPGVSRSGITILGSRLLGYERSDAAKFSFLLGTPSMVGAALLKTDELMPALSDSFFYFGVLSSAISGFFAIGFLLSFLRKFGFLAFAIYRMVLAIIIIFVMY